MKDEEAASTQILLNNIAQLASKKGVMTVAVVLDLCCGESDCVQVCSAVRHLTGSDEAGEVQ